MKRKTVSIEDHQLERIESILDPDTPTHAAFRWAVEGEAVKASGRERGAVDSESNVLRWLISLGLERVRDLELEAAYAELARSYDADDQTEDEAFLALGAETWADDA